MQRCLGQGEAPPGRERGDTTLWSFISVYMDDIHQELGAKPRLARSWGSPGHLPGRGTRHPTWTEGLVQLSENSSQSPLRFQPRPPTGRWPFFWQSSEYLSTARGTSDATLDWGTQTEASTCRAAFLDLRTSPAHQIPEPARCTGRDEANKNLQSKIQPPKHTQCFTHFSTTRLELLPTKRLLVGLPNHSLTPGMLT